MSSDAEQKKPTYPGGMAALLSEMEARRGPFGFAEGEDLPQLDVDLKPLVSQIILNPADDPDLDRNIRSSFHRKQLALREEFTGLSELCCLNALLIANLRKREQPPQTAALFNRLWAEHSDHLIPCLNQRWLVSAITTFGDHGANETQRNVGRSLTVLFGMMKLYESERLYSGVTSDRPFTVVSKARGPLPLEMDQYSVLHGGLDINMLGRLWQEAEGDATVQPLAHHLLDLLIHDERTLFRRLRAMRGRMERRNKKSGTVKAKKPSKLTVDIPRSSLPDKDAPLRWGLVSTIKAPLPAIARWAAHHLDLGADALHIFLDEPSVETADWLSRDPRIHVTQCDDTYWTTQKNRKIPQHQLRQAFNATRVYANSNLHWLGHIDVDEFLLTRTPIAQLLRDVPDMNAMARVSPAEFLAPVSSGGPQHFKLTYKSAGAPKSVIEEIYPTFGLHLNGGFISHTSGKVFARTGLGEVRLGVHALRHRQGDIENAVRLDDIYLGHFHAPSWDVFERHYEFRRTKGSYRHVEGAQQMGLPDVLGFLEKNEGRDGLRQFFDEVCLATPVLTDRLAQHNMLLTQEIDFDATTKRVFGELPDA